MSSWQELTLGQLINDGCAELQTGPFGTMLNASEYTASGTPVIAVQDIGENKLIHNKFVYVDDNTVERLSKYRVLEGDIIFGRKGAVERRARIQKHEEGWLQGSDCIRVRFNDSIDSSFISYQFGSKTYREWMLQNSGGATMPSLNQEILKLLPIKLPGIEEQKAIATVLSSLDDKIDLLHRQNKTLEAMAETLFRQWFVEEAQEDWGDVRIDQLVEINARSLDKLYQYTNILYLDTGSLNQGVISELQSFTIEDAPSRAKRLVKHNDVLISTVRPDQKHYGIIKRPQDNLVVSTGFCVLSCIGIDPHFIYLLLTSNEMTEYLHSLAEGSTSTYPSLKPSDIGSLIFKKPPPNKLQEFADMSKSTWDKIFTNHNQIKTLEKLRDTLLPKLMSGEVRVAL